MAINLLVPLVGPLVLGGLSLLPGANWLRRLSGIFSGVLVLCAGVTLVAADRSAQAPVAASGILRADALSAYMLAVIGAVGIVATWGGLVGRGTDAHSDSDDSSTSRDPAAKGPRPEGSPPEGMYSALICVFLAAMSLAVIADNLGVMWVAVEATTIATAFLVGYHRTRLSLEAAWKYVVLGSVGVAIAFLGIVLLYASSGGTATPTLSWTALSQMHADLNPALVRVGAALAVLGFATKAGLAPMHSWLPDAHGQAPAPVSALMSGVLLSVALYAILRIQSVADRVIGPEFLRTLLVVGGLLSLAIAAALLIRQRDYKRMLAYSSIEHMGVMALGAAVGPAALSAVLLYMLSHGLVKACLFVLSGRLLALEGTTRIADIRGLLGRRPGIAVPWLIGIIGLIGFPPFGIFLAQLNIVLAGWAAGMGVIMAIALALILVIFAALVRSTVRMMFGPGEVEGAAAVAPDRAAHGPRLPLALALAACAVIPFLAGPIGMSLTAAVASLGEGR